MIPKVIHYVWVGGKPLTPLAELCIASWKKYLPDYQLQLWNESSLPSEVMEHPYVQAMYEQKKWAFVSDYIRFWALKNEGGIYFDTDTEVLKSFDDLLKHEAFFGKSKDGFVAAGVIGTVPEHRVIQDILNVYNNDRVFSTQRTSPHTVTDVLERNSYPDVVVYDYQYFNPCNDGEKCTVAKLKLAYTNNHWAESWVPFAKLRKLFRRLGITAVSKRMLELFN